MTHTHTHTNTSVLYLRNLFFLCPSNQLLEKITTFGRPIWTQPLQDLTSDSDLLLLSQTGKHSQLGPEKPGFEQLDGEKQALFRHAGAPSLQETTFSNRFPTKLTTIFQPRSSVFKQPSLNPRSSVFKSSLFFSPNKNHQKDQKRPIKARPSFCDQVLNNDLWQSGKLSRWAKLKSIEAFLCIFPKLSQTTVRVSLIHFFSFRCPPLCLIVVSSSLGSCSLSVCGHRAGTNTSKQNKSRRFAFLVGVYDAVW